MGTTSRHRRRWVSLAGWLVLAWTALFGVVVGIGWLLTHALADSVGRVDTEFARWLAEHRTPQSTRVAEASMLLGETPTGVVALVALALLFSIWRRSVIPGLFVALVGAGLVGIYRGAGFLVPRTRPPVRILDPGLAPDHSFPSGHVATALAICGCLVVLLIWVRGSRARPWLLLLLLPLCTLAARLYQGAHYLSDALTSLTYTGVWIGVVGALLLRTSTPDRLSQESSA